MVEDERQGTVDKNWEHMKNAIKNLCRDNIRIQPKKLWGTDEMIKKMEEIRKKALK